MNERNAPSRGFTIGGGIIAVAGLAAALTLNAGSFTQADWILTLCGAVAFCFVALNGLPVRGLRMRRTGLAAEALFLDLPIAVSIFAIAGSVGPTALALAYGLGFGAASLVRGERVADLPRHGVLRMLVALSWLPFMGALATINALPDSQQVPLAALATFCFYVVFIFGVSIPVSSYTFHISIARLWERVARDERTWGLIAGSAIWAMLEGYEVAHGRPFTAIVMWLPVCLIAVLLRTIEREHAEVVRLRLVRDAVQAMLGDRDPLPQINAILGTLRVPSFQETVSVFAATSTRTENWRVVTTIGPMLSSAGDELGRRILVRLRRQREDPETERIDEHVLERDEYYSAYAFAASVAEGELQGALTVHRRNDRPLTSEQIQQFANAARELAPLLRDMRAIAAQQSAATIDGLTGLCNRATTMDRLQTMLAQVSITECGAVLLLDIDHFKTINDELGHATGDNCLRRVGEIIRATVRGGDTAGRVGGEEFLVVMPGASRDVALSVGERLRLAVSLSGMRYANGEPITTSIGAAATRVGDTIETLLARADRGLYEAKRQGRNRLVEDRETA